MSRERCLRKESVLQLPHEVVEQILEKLAVKSLLRFKAVSKQWRSTIESQFFQGRHLTHRQRSGDPDVLMVSERPYTGTDTLRTMVLGSSSVKIPTPWEETSDKTLSYCVSHNSCDGLLCLFYPNKSFVFNPATRWYRALPRCKSHQPLYPILSTFGFGKDIFTSTYKPVWLFNSFELGLKNATTCEVFDFTTNAWRYVTPAAPYRVLALVNPVFVDGSLYWLTDCKETKVVSFDLHTEAFQVISKAHFLNSSDPYKVFMCNLDNRLCVSEMKWPKPVISIWSFSSSNKTWDKTYSINLDVFVVWFPNYPVSYVVMPLAFLKKKKKLFYDPVVDQELFLTRVSETKRDEVAFSGESTGVPVCYFPSLISIL